MKNYPSPSDYWSEKQVVAHNLTPSLMGWTGFNFTAAATAKLDLYLQIG